MFINCDCEKFLYFVVFFVKNVEKCGKIKLFKFLYFFDFEYYKLIGCNVIGMDYFVW